MFKGWDHEYETREQGGVAETPLSPHMYGTYLS